MRWILVMVLTTVVGLVAVPAGRSLSRSDVPGWHRAMH
jgi:hypothetical protein